MKEFKNGDEVIVENGFGRTEKLIYIGPHPANHEKAILASQQSTDLLLSRYSCIKPKPATTNINGLEVPKPLTKEDADDCRVTATPLTLFFRSYEDAARFDNALNGLKEGCDDE